MSAKTVLQKILRRAAVAFDNNRYSKHNRGTLSADNTPTITGYTVAAFATAGGPAAFPHVYSATDTGPFPYVFGGGTPDLDGFGLRYKSANGEGHSAWHDYVHHGQDFVIELEDYVSTYRFLVKENGSFKYVDPDGIGGTPAGSSGTARTGEVVYKLHFPTRSYREIRVETYAKGAQGGGSFDTAMGRIGAVRVAAGDQVFAPREQGVSAVIVSNSNDMGINGPSADARGHVMFAHLGVDNVRNASVWGVGASSWDDRHADWLDIPQPDMIDFECSWTDTPSPDVSLMITEIELARETWPDAVIIVQGVIQAKGETDMDALNAATKTAVEGLNDNLIRYEELQTAFEGPFYGTESGLTGNYAEMINTGNGHYSRAGDMHIGIHAAQQRIALLEDILENIPEATGTGGIVLLPDSATLQFEQDVSRSQGLTVASSGSLVAVSNVVPTLPVGLEAVIDSNGGLVLTGTPTTLTAADDYAITVELSGGGYLLFSLNLEVVEELVEFTLDMLYPTADMAHYAAYNTANTVYSTGLISVLDDLSGNGRDATAQGPLSPSELYETGVETLNGRALLTGVSGTHNGRFDMAVKDLSNNTAGMSFYMLIRLDDPALSPYYGAYLTLTEAGSSNARAAIFGGGLANNDTLLGGRRYTPGENLRTIRDATDREGMWQVISGRIDYYNGTACLRINGDETTGGLVFDSGYGQTAATDSLEAVLTTNLPDRALAEVIVRRGYDSDTLAKKVEGRLAWDWNVRSVLASDHPYKNTLPLA